LNVIGEGVSRARGVSMTRDMRGRFWECVSGGMGYRRTFFSMRIVHSVVVVLVDMGREKEVALSQQRILWPGAPALAHFHWVNPMLVLVNRYLLEAASIDFGCVGTLERGKAS
jgi:hypothetical protein